MNTKIIRSSELGTECWLPIRHLGQCWRCDRYWQCKLAVRVVCEEFERLVAAAERARKQLKDFKERR